MNNFAVYNASAGSGKTFTLVKEYLKIALENDSDNQYKNILAVTFTNKAASEMKERVISALQSLSGQKALEGTPKHLMEALLLPVDKGGLGATQEQIVDRSKKVLKSILHNYGNFAIGTIDKFTHKIIRTFAHDLHLPLNFDIELNENEVLDKSIDLLISEIGSNEKITKLLIEYAGKKAEDEASWHIEKDLKNFAKNLIKEDGEIHLQQLRNLTIDDFEEIKKELSGSIKSFEKELSLLATNAIAEVHNKGINEKSFSRSFYTDYWKKLLNLKDFTPTATFLKIINGEQNWYAKTVPQDQQELIDSNQQEFITWYNTSKALIDNKGEEYFVNKLLIRNIYNLAVLNEIEKTIQEYKKENSVLSISDFNKKIAKIVASEPIPFIYERLGEKYKHYLIDEFQDTSIIQWHNLIPLIDNSLADGKFSMIVGDAKQAIYRFRGGEVDQIIKLPYLHNNNNNELIKEREAAFVRNYKKENLESNFRSKAEVVDFNNQFFSFIANNLSGTYKEIYNNLSQNYIPANIGGGVEIDLLEAEGKDEFDEITYNRILEIIAHNTSETEGYKLDDIAILTRGNKEGSAIATILLEKGIPVVSSESLLLNNSAEVKFLINIFNFLSNPKEVSFQLPVINYLINNQFTTDKLIDIYNHKNTSTLELYLLSKELMLDYKNIANYSLYELTEYLIRHFNLDQEVNIYIQFFLDKIQEYASRFDNSVVNFLEWWKNKSSKFSIVIPDGINAVKIMSIHKSKGLEFPVVIYPYADSVSKNTENFSWINDTNIERFKTAILPLNNSLKGTKYESILNDEVEKSKLDLVNILYVALTRPKDRLYILSKMYEAPKKPSQSNSINISKLFFDYCELNPSQKVSDSTYQFGIFSPNEKDEVNGENKNEEFTSVVYNNWRDKIEISFQAPEVWETEYLESATEYGRLVHKILADIETIGDLESVIKKYQLAGIINSKEAEDINKEINEILSLSAIKPFFTDIDKVINETSILLPSGKTYQPDRVVQKNNETFIIDYKTGNQETSHLKQLSNYQTILLEMGYTNVKSYLLYIKDRELVSL
ncbi:AAA family ATPase [Vicingus serpentipes]|uniref:DNA 3'-5' helicase n=1 Tax=Vicingus serpentipes TaxID=1926625 RepID=A0A5C6RY04_9FLAO|nr:UvrD-helicase domain-containing protein [Vicingus serpentipes]TXB66729.1 AAA family ATPase [Vicingus serpentipes]